MYYIVLDLEWNQGTPKTERPEIPFEVIEIGAVKLDEKKDIVDRFESRVCPVVYDKIYFMTAKVTGITMDELKDEDEFPAVFKRFVTWCGDDFIFCTWGSLDLLELRKNIAYHKLEPLGRGPVPYLDIQKLYSLELDDGKSRKSLEKAVDALEIDKSDVFHRADGDAWYTAEIFRRLKRRDLEAYESYDVYRLPGSRGEEVHVKFPTYSKYISRAFRDKNTALRDKEATSLKCFICGKETKRYISWVTVNGKQFFAMGKCREHGMMRGHLRIKKNWDGATYVMKTIRPAKQGDEGSIRMKEKNAALQAEKLNKMQRAQKSKLSNSEK